MNVGGQAVIEGVMMRNKEKFAIAVRKPDGSIEIKKEKAREFPKFFSWPFVRGALGLWFTLYDGIRALIWSGNQQLDEDEVIKPLFLSAFKTISSSILVTTNLCSTVVPVPVVGLYF